MTCMTVHAEQIHVYPQHIMKPLPQKSIVCDAVHGVRGINNVFSG
jgi:hypothetical protein